MLNDQITGQKGQKSTTVWSQPSSPEQQKFFSTHAAERRVFGWISAFLQAAHGLLAVASFSAIFSWVLQAVPSVHFLIPFASIATIIALHLLFRTTWSTYWYDRLDTDEKTDSPIWVPVAIIVLLLVVEVNGAKMFLSGQVKPPEKQNTEQSDQEYHAICDAIVTDYQTEKGEINQLYAQKSQTAAAPYDRQIRSLSRKAGAGDNYAKSQTASLKAQKDKALEPIAAEKTAALDAAFAKRTARKDAADARRTSTVASIDNANAGEVSRFLTETGSVNTYAWVLSVALLTLISALIYRMVHINVKSGILPLRNYTVLDAHGSVAERIWTALSDAFNRRGLQAAVAVHRFLSPKGEITGFDGTVVATPGVYNTPPGFFPPSPTPPAAPERRRITLDTTGAGTSPLRSSMAGTSVRGSYMGSDALPEARVAPTSPTPSSRDKELKWLAGIVQDNVDAYDAAIQGGDKQKADEMASNLYNPSGIIATEAKRLGIQFEISKEDDEVVVCSIENPSHKVPISMLSESALSAWDVPTQAENDQIRFKSDLNQFDDEIRLIQNAGLIGISYKKEDGRWSPIGEAQVRSRFKIAKRNAEEEEPSPKVLRSFAKWAYAMQLIAAEKAQPKEPELQAA